MCGIAGIVDITSAVTKDRLKRMTDMLIHRGPDGEGQWVNEQKNVGLGHRRLSILDLSMAGAQPMHFADRYSIVFNGEIYNYIELKEQCISHGYHFHTGTDTEVLLALFDWKKENCLELLDGMFAFAIYDNKEHELFCARDRFGEKPFYYSYEAGNHFIFASEMKALWSAGIQKEPNKKMLLNYLAFDLMENTADPGETFYENCFSLPHSFFLTISVHDCTIERFENYYDINWQHQDYSISEKHASEILKELFYTSVSRRLRSDVPVGSSLSGGLDSSLIVSIINELKKNSPQKQKTFSVRFPGFIGDEGVYMESIINQTNVDPYYTFPQEQTFKNILHKVLYHQEEPFAGPSVLAQYEVMALAKKHDVTVLLDGQGADEMFAGYHHYFVPFFKNLYKQDRKEYNIQLNEYDSLMETNRFNPKMRYTAIDNTKAKIKQVIRKSAPRYYAARRIKKLAEYNMEWFPDYESYMYAGNNSFNTLQEALYSSMLKNGLQVLLRFADRNSMAHSREVRLPFLNHKLVEFVFSLPAHFKIKNGWTKYILRTTFDSILPGDITWRKEKIGFASPQIINKDHLTDIENTIGELDFVNRRYISKIDLYKKISIYNLVRKNRAS